MLKIWGRQSSSNVQKVLWTCQELGIAYERIDVGGPFGGLDTVSYRLLNPNGLVPTMEHGDFILWESHAIIRYLAAGDIQGRLLPKTLTPHAHAKIDQWMYWAMVGLGLSLRDLFMLLKPGAPPPSAAQIELTNAPVSRLFTVLNAHVEGSDYIGGGDFTLADIACGVSAHRWMSLAVARPALPALERWYATIALRPGFEVIKKIPVP